MKRYKFMTMLAIAATAITLTACGEEEDNPVPAVPEIYIISTDTTTAGQPVAKTTLAAGATLQLTPIVTHQEPEDVEIVWETSDAQVVTVTETGLVKAVGKGVATITVSANYYLPPLTATLTIEVVDDLIDIDDQPVDQHEAEARKR